MDRKRPAWTAESYVHRTQRDGACLSSLSIRPTPDGYLAYLAIYVQPVHRFTRLYMWAITPFRRLVVYPAIIRKVQSLADRYGITT